MCSVSASGGAASEQSRRGRKRVGKRWRRRRSRRGKVVQGQRCSAPTGRRRGGGSSLPARPSSRGCISQRPRRCGRSGRFWGLEPARGCPACAGPGLWPPSAGTQKGRDEAAAGRVSSAKLRKPRLSCLVASGRRAGSALRMLRGTFYSAGMGSWGTLSPALLGDGADSLPCSEAELG